MVPTSSPNPNPTPSSSGGFNPSGLIAVGLTTVVDLMIKKGDLKKQLELEKKINNLTLQQQQELEQKLRATTSETERYGILYKTIAINENQKILDNLSKSKYKNVAIIGVGLILLTLMVVINKKRKS